MISNVLSVLFIISLSLVFGFLHSFLALKKVKLKIKNKVGELIVFYRLIYNLSSLIILYLIYQISPRPDVIIYDLPKPYDILILVPQFLSLIGFIWTLKYFSGSEFLGISQIIRWYNNTYDFNDIDEHATLRIKGPYTLSRHPLYFFSILYLGFRPTMDLFYLTFFICITIYFYIGSIYEEKKLVDLFGKNYTFYQSSIPRIFPYKFIHPFGME